MVVIENYGFLVSVLCETYNQSKYITDTLDGFVIQQTTFPFVAIVVDDASIDGEQKVIKDYINSNFDRSIDLDYCQWESEDAHWEFARHAENKNCYIVAVYLKRNLYKEWNKKIAVVKDWLTTKYFAYCEGDDYWIDPKKLQKQVGFLEEHNEYDLCCSASRVYEQRKGCFTGIKGTVLCENYYSIVQDYNDINTATVMTRMGVWHECNKELASFLSQEMMIDTAFWYWFAFHRKIKYFSEQMAVYRVLENSACHSTDKEKSLLLGLSFLRLKLEFLFRYPLAEGHIEVVNKIIQEVERLCHYSRYLGESSVRNTKTFSLGSRIKRVMKWQKKRK